jgi:hypothetical protein
VHDDDDDDDDNNNNNNKALFFSIRGKRRQKLNFVVKCYLQSCYTFETTEIVTNLFCLNKREL